MQGFPLMAHGLSLARRTQIIGALVESNSIRSTERMTDTHGDTIMRLMVEVGTGCAKIADEQMRNLDCRRIQCDEIWSFVKVKQARIPRFTDRTKIGDQWTFVAIDPDIPSWFRPTVSASALVTTPWRS